MPNFDIVIEKAPKKPVAAEAKKEAPKKGGDAKKTDSKKVEKPK